jgi:5-methylcytosine-specific restriction endonuclease McrA
VEEPVGPVSVRTIEGGAEVSVRTLDGCAEVSARTLDGRPARLVGLSSGRYGLQLTVSQDTRDLLIRAQALLGHSAPSGDIETVLKQALRELVHRLEKRKCAETSRPRTPRATKSSNLRHVPAHIRRAVWQRDGGQCTFVGGAGRRCQERGRLEFDHVQEVARGGEATVDGMRLRCRAHNQYTAEQTFGTEFMRHKRKEAATIRAAARATRLGLSRATASGPEPDPAAEILAALRTLKYRQDELRQATAFIQTLPDGPIEQRVLATIRHLGKLSGLGRRVEHLVEEPDAAKLTSD